MSVKVLTGDCREVLAGMEPETVQTCVTSPPYFGLRNYGVDGQIGLESTVEAYVAELVTVFREVRRVLKDDGTLWLNLGDSYNSFGRTGGATEKQATNVGSFVGGPALNAPGLKHKDMIGIPWRVAFALQADGWYLRSDIIWHKPNPMPESVTDRPTKSHEYIFLLAKSQRYFYNAAAIAEPVADATVARMSQPNLENQRGSYRVPGKTNGPMKPVIKKQDATGNKTYIGFNERFFNGNVRATRNNRTVWTISTKPFSGAHFATFPPDLIEPCIKAGSKPGDLVLDPFGGAGTTGLVASRLARSALLVELNPDYAAMAQQRIEGDAPLLTEATT
jgi:DNA modification methylase